LGPGLDDYIIDKPEAKSQSQLNPKREKGIWPLGCHYNLIDHIITLSQKGFKSLRDSK